MSRSGSNELVENRAKVFSTKNLLGREVGREGFSTSSNEPRSRSRSRTLPKQSPKWSRIPPPLYKGEGSLPDRSTMRGGVSRD